MEDYSDKTLRALIRQLIAEDKAQLSRDPVAGTDRRGLFSVQILNIVRAIFTPGGFAALTAAGFLIEPQLTTALLSGAIKTAKDAIDAIDVYNKTEGNVFDKLGEVFSTLKDTNRANKMKFYRKVYDNKDKSFSAQLLNDFFVDAENFKVSDKEIKRGDVKKSDVILIETILEEKPISRVFNENRFFIDANKNLGVKFIKDDTVRFELDDNKESAVINDLESLGYYLDANILRELYRADRALQEGKTQEFKEAMNSAKSIYNGAIAISEEPSDELQKTFLLKSMDNIEGGLENEFERMINSIGRRAEAAGKEKAKDLIDFAVSSVKDSLKKT
jgi:hypothetical protein